jgi:iron complex transport system ATP-binding protein
VGPNGGGKTTLLRAVLGLAKLSSGQALLFGEAVRTLDDSRRASLAAYMPQDRRVGWNLPAWSIAALGRPDLPPGRAKPAALAALAEVGLANLAERGVLDMSGGERARVLLARMIATGAPALVADEPVAGLDPDAQMLVMEVLRARASQGAAVMVSLHDLTLAARHCDRIAVMAGGRLLAVGAPSEALSPEILTRAFGLRGRLEPTEFGPIMVATRI